MSNALIVALRQSDVNKLIIEKLHAHNGKVGQLSTDGINPDPLPSDMIEGLNATIEELMVAIKEMHSTFLANNIAVRSSEDYVTFMCDFLPAYFQLASHDEVMTMKKEEVEALVIAQCANTSVGEKRRQLIQNSFVNQTVLTIEQVAEQFKEIEDGILEEAYKTLLHSQLNSEIQPL